MVSALPSSQTDAAGNNCITKADHRIVIIANWEAVGVGKADVEQASTIAAAAG